MDEEENKGEDIQYRVRVLLIYQRCKYMIDDHKERRRFLHVARISGFMYKLDLMTFVLYFGYYHFGHYYIFWTLSSGSLLSCIYGLHIDVGRTLLIFYL